MNDAAAKRKHQRSEALRDRKIEQIEEARVRKFRENQYLEQAKAAQTVKFGGDGEGEGEEDEQDESNLQVTRTKTEKKEQKEFQKTFEPQQRAQRREERAGRIKKEEAK